MGGGMSAAKKVTITVPDDLAERLDPWRDRMNISKVCSRAISQEIKDLEGTSQWSDEFGLVVDRLRFEKAGGNWRDYNRGYERGLEYALELAGLAEFEWAAEQTSDEAGPKTLPSEAETRLDRLIQDGRVDDQASYRKGWLTGMLEVWDEVKDRL
jgi:post-segregation antitoxin (ccd killing protein)